MSGLEELAEAIIDSLRNDPESWSFGACKATCGRMDIWIANRDYADLKIGDLRIGSKGQRKKIRELIDNIVCRRAIIAMGNSVEIEGQKPPKRLVDRVLRRLERL